MWWNNKGMLGVNCYGQVLACFLITDKCVQGKRKIVFCRDGYCHFQLLCNKQKDPEEKGDYTRK
jgi:hypothetical protein